MILRLIMPLLYDFDLQKYWILKINERYNEFLLLKENILNIESVLLFYMLYSSRTNKFLYFFLEYTIKFVRKVSSTDDTI